MNHQTLLLLFFFLFCFIPFNFTTIFRVPFLPLASTSTPGFKIRKMYFFPKQKVCALIVLVCWEILYPKILLSLSLPPLLFPCVLCSCTFPVSLFLVKEIISKGLRVGGRREIGIFHAHAQL